jgi:hypothetical protein
MQDVASCGRWPMLKDAALQALLPATLPDIAGLRLVNVFLCGLLPMPWLLWAVQQLAVIVSVSNLECDCKTQAGALDLGKCRAGFLLWQGGASGAICNNCKS